ncbi:uncharacterized protein LOC115114435 isoform X1 [Oncorhynchus nerka]|uniref:uncharacterized protein LOC115114435 isoform X1 n=1 Tax=Oncorhynchus nerka TaxID=8023 RepID=UPI0031B812FB
MIMGRYTDCAQELLYKAEDEHGEELSEDEEAEEEDGPIDEEAQLKASIGLPVEFISSSAQKRAGRKLMRKNAIHWEAAPENLDKEDPPSLQVEKNDFTVESTKVAFDLISVRGQEEKQNLHPPRQK